MNHAAHSQAQGNATLLDSTLGIQNAAGIVEAVVGGRHVNAVAGDAGRVILLRCGGNLRREGGQQANQGLLGGVVSTLASTPSAPLNLTPSLSSFFSTEQMRAWAYCT